MTQFYIVEIKKFQNGEYEHNVHWAFDADADKARLKAESKYHEVLSAAAVSETAEHSAIMFSTEGFPIMHQCYKHVLQQAEPEEETVEYPDD